MPDVPVSDVLPMWVVYDHPSDYPAHFTARLHEISSGVHLVTDQVLTSATLEPLREQLAQRGLICITRNEEDDPVIVETWL